MKRFFNPFLTYISVLQKQLPGVFCKKGVLRNFVEIHRCQGLFFNKAVQRQILVFLFREYFNVRLYFPIKSIWVCYKFLLKLNYRKTTTYTKMLVWLFWAISPVNFVFFRKANTTVIFFIFLPKKAY